MDQVSRFLTKLFRGVGSARSTRLLGLVERSEWSLLQQERTSEPSVYQNSDAYFRDALCVDIIRKLKIPSDEVKLTAKAVETFWASEAQCANTNLRLTRYLERGPFDQQDMRVDDFISRWRKNVKRVFGPLPDLLNPRFSGGSTLSDKGLLVTIPDKMSSVPTAYAGSLDILEHSVRGTILARNSHRTVCVSANKFFTVPKDSEKHRGCCVEPSGSVVLQLDIDRILKRRYESVYKVRFDHLPDLHRERARSASRSDGDATIDLSNASDTVSKLLVKLLLPREWFELLDLLRAKRTEVFGRTVWLEKFSSMGNGFTFMLETIIFKTLCDTLNSEGSSCFGDDIIIEKHLAPDLLSALRFFGFTPNARKTFCEGPFRESCGGDFFDGQLVRAHFLKDIPNEPQHWVALANGLRRVDPDLRYARAAWRFCIDQVPVGWRRFHADQSLGDFSFYDPAASPQFAPDKTSGVLLPFWSGKRAIPGTVSVSKYFQPDVQLAAYVYGCIDQVPLRDVTIGYKDARICAWGTNWLPKQ